MPLAFRPFDPSKGLAAQRELFRDCFPEAVGQPAESEEHYRWKFQSAPGSLPAYEHVALLDGNLVGYYAAIPYRYRIGGRMVIAGMVCDVMTGTAARGKGVFTKLGAHALAQLQAAGIDLVTGYPIRPEVIPGHLKVGWSIVAKLPVYVKVVRTDALLSRYRLGLLAPLANLAVSLSSRIAALGGASGYTAKEISIEDLLTAAWYPQFLEQWMASVRNALCKEAPFMRWRLGAPGTNYRIFLAQTSIGEPVGVCVARSTLLHGLPTMAVLDLMLLPRHTAAFRAIDGQLLRCARILKCELIATMISAAHARRYGFCRALYLKSPHVFSFIVKRLSPAVKDREVLLPEMWHTMWIDSDDL